MIFEFIVILNVLVLIGVFLGLGGFWGVFVVSIFDGKSRWGLVFESVGDMFVCWESEGVDVENVVWDVLRVGCVFFVVV